MGKRLEAMRSNPQGNWRMDDIEALCTEHGIRCAAPRGGGSHYRISHPDLEEKLTVPFKRPIKPVYIRKLVAFIDRLENARNAP
jgi:predicted RNA binding protein YcfA (HicA-like mRNA interferase family)